MHTRLTGWVVGPPMLLELATGLLLLICRPAAVTMPMAWLGVGLLAVNWLSTQLIQVPCHAQLSQIFDPAVHRRLVTTNWIRTITWSLRGALVCGMVWSVWTCSENSPFSQLF